MEFLSSQFSPKDNTFPVNLVLQSAQSVTQGYNAVGTGNYVVANLPFNPTTGFHEYRIDFVPGSVIFYADGEVLTTMHTSAIPTQAGHLILTQWSNGNPLWSAGPPTIEAIVTVGYVKSYFNSSLVSRIDAFASRCGNQHISGAICSIPDQRGAPDPTGPNGNRTANTYFFSDVKNMTDGQILFHQSKGTRNVVPWQLFPLLFLLVPSHLTL
jgi:Glycosyl hydrolases family 16